MAKSYQLGGYNNPRGGRWRSVFVIIILVQIAGVAAYLYYSKKDKKEQTEELPALAEPGLPGLGEPAPAEPMGLAPAAPSAPAMMTSTPESRAAYSDALSAFEAGQLAEAKKVLDQAYETSPDADLIDLLGKVNMAILKSPRPMPGKERSSIVSGDSLSKIAKKYNSTVALIKEMNGMSSDVIRAGAGLMVYKCDFSIRVSKTHNTLDLLDHGKLFKRYSVGTGKWGKTPAIEFKIVDKIKEPPWTRFTDGKQIEYGDPENVLGTRWMKITSAEHPEITGFGIHGTWERDSIGKQSSAGCVRMLNEDVEELFDLVPRKTTVIITE
jgi:lipoprotein-anchoring transpeptidase ErfK/SrfK